MSLRKYLIIKFTTEQKKFVKRTNRVYFKPYELE